ncbi:MAG TPA: DUF6492 family protein [Sunxiuqinia sp.]|nr:DUF6492 family protein [Sunxiuqinia sp.]
MANKHLKLIEKNIRPSHIYILTNRCFFFYFKKAAESISLPITLLDEDTLLETVSFQSIENLKKVKTERNIGWFYQQFLKMGFALTQYAKDDYYLIWDADTLPLTPLSFFEGNKPLMTLKEEYHEPYFETINKLFDLQKSIGKSFIAENMLVNVQIMKEMIQAIEDNEAFEGTNWCEKIIHSLHPNYKNDFSEFETYGTYVVNHYPELYKTRELKCFRNAGKKVSRLASTEYLVKKFSGYDLISLEKRHNPKNLRGLPGYIQKGIFYLINKTRKRFNIS